jgi:hypothetical protein
MTRPQPPDPAEIVGIGLSRRAAAAYGITGRRRYGAGVEHLSRDTWVLDPALAPERRVALLVDLAPETGALSHYSAAHWYRLPVDRHKGHGPVHVTVPPSGPAPQRRQLTVHVRELPAADVTMRWGVPITTPERLFVDMSGELSREGLVVLGDAILNRGLATVDTLAARVANARRARGVCLARQTLPLLDGRAQSPPETLLRLRLIAAKLPPPVPQLAVDLGFAVVHVDMGWEAVRVGLQYEGAQHAEQGPFELDLRRYSELAARGWLIIRASRADLSAGSRALLGRVRTALQGRGLAC